MLHIETFTFNPFAENTYIVHDDNEAWIIDPGNSTDEEHREIAGYLKKHDLKLTRLLLTHAHIDHVMGNAHIHDEYGLLPEMHTEDLFFIERMGQSASMYGLKVSLSPSPKNFLQPGQTLALGTYTFKILHAPGHSPGSICFYNEEEKVLIGGDVLFRGSIGRSDLPLGDAATLIRSIGSQLLALPDDVTVYPGHGPTTTIGEERRSNPFLS